MRGLLLDQARRLDEAEEMLRKALSLNPNLSDAANWLANLTGDSGRVDEAMAILESIVERDPMYGPAFGNLVAGYMGRSDHDKADALINRVEEFVGENDEVLQSRGIAEYVRGDLASAYRDLGIVLRDNPNASVVQMWYGFSLLDIGEFEAAVESANAEHRMLALAELGYVDEARRAVQEIDVVGTFPQRVLRDVARFFIKYGEPQELIDYVDRHFGSLDNLLAAYPVSRIWSIGYLPELTYAHMQLGKRRNRQPPDRRGCCRDRNATQTRT